MNTTNSTLPVVRRLRRLMVIAVMASGGGAWSETRWDLASAYAANNFHTENLTQFAADVEKATNGQLKIAIHANASLFKAPEIKKAIQSGQIQAGEIFLSNHEKENPLFGVDGVPFLATSYRSAKGLYAAQKPALQRLLKEQGIMLLYTVPWPAQGLYSTKTVESVAEMRGIKWRAYSPATTRMGELIGGKLVTVQAADLSQALANGTVEAYLSSSIGGVDSKAYERVKNFYDLQALLPKNAVLVSTQAFLALDKAQQEALIKAAAVAEERGWKLSAQKNEASKKTLADKGMKILDPSSTLVADMKQLSWTMIFEWQKKAGTDGESVIANYFGLPATAATAVPASKAMATSDAQK
jgi:TRAP-type transport system periplasmic protein